jgi:hypothetical protein
MPIEAREIFIELIPGKWKEKEGLTSPTVLVSRPQRSAVD